MGGSRRRLNGEGSFYWRDDLNLWCGQFVLGKNPATGRPVRKTVYGKTVKEAQEAMDKAREEARNTAPVASSLTVEVACDLWWINVKHSLQASSLHRYLTDLKAIKKGLGRTKVVELTPIKVIQWLDKMETEGCSADKRKKSLVRLKQLLKVCVQMGYLTKNPAEQVRSPLVKRAEQPALTQAQVQALTEAARGTRDEALIAVALDTGARQGEVFGLLWEDYDAEVGTLRIIRSLEECDNIVRLKDTKTAGSRRTVHLGKSARAALDRHRPEKAGPKGLIFSAPGGGFLRKSTWHRRAWTPLLKRAGLTGKGIHFHSLRHTVASALLGCGVDVKTVSVRLGHSSASVTLQIYAHVMPGGQERAAVVMDGWLGGDSSRNAVDAEKGTKKADPHSP
jgi:integrase